MRHVSIPCFLLSEDLLLRLKPVIKRTLTDASFVDLVGSCGDPFVEIYRHGRCVRIWFRSAGGSLARRLRFGRFLRFHGFPPMSSIISSRPDKNGWRSPTARIGVAKAWRPSAASARSQGLALPVRLQQQGASIPTADASSLRHQSATSGELSVENFCKNFPSRSATA